MPICFSLDPARPALYTPLDEKPKRDDDPLALARVRDIRADPRLVPWPSDLAARWDEDWVRLAWLRGRGVSPRPGPGRRADRARGRGRRAPARYPQYERHRLEARPIIRISLARITDWGRLGDMED